MSRILIIEDEPVIRRHAVRLLSQNGYAVDEAESVAEAEQKGLRNFDLIISDVRLPGLAGTDVIQRAKPVPVLIMTSYASVRSAVDSMRLGAADYIAKPFDYDEMLMTVSRILKEHLQSRQNAALRQDLRQDWPTQEMVGDCEAMHRVRDHLSRVAPTEVTVLIRGESGTGKELVARAIHERSRRSGGPFIAVNCAAIPENLIEAELFGYEKGAFTGAARNKDGLFVAAHGGTLFLDEIGELSASVQAHLLRALQEGEIRSVGSNLTRRVDVRVLAATHRDLEQMLRERSFREDLYYRLRVMELHLPPLRERGEDLVALAQHLLERSTRKLGRADLKLGARALAAIRRHPWPGNVRELANALERAAILTDGSTIDPEHLALPEAVVEPAREAVSAAVASLDEYFRNFVQQNQHRMTEAELAKALGISRKTLWERRTRMGLLRRG